VKHIRESAMPLNAKRSGEQNWQSRPRPRVISTVPPATSLSLSPGISSDLRGISTTLAGGPAAYRVSEKRAGKTFSASPSTRQSTPQHIRYSSGCLRSCHIFPARRLYQPGVELFQQGVAYQFAK
jgi:hypothetical protein